MIKRISSEDLGKKPHPVLSAASIHGDLVFTAGRVGMEKDGTFSTSVERQTELAIAELKLVLEAAGSSLDSILKVLLFIKNPEDAPKINKVYMKYMKAKPSRSCISVAFPNPGVLLEMECVAVKKSASKL